MDTKRIYTADQMNDADRLAKAIASVPEEKRHAFVRVIEAMMMGAEMAERMANADTTTNRAAGM